MKYKFDEFKLRIFNNTFNNNHNIHKTIEKESASNINILNVDNTILYNN